MSKKNINYNIFIDPLLPKEIMLNSMKTKRTIMNLIGNASKFTPENGSIEFSVRYKDKEKKLHIFVKDNGIGIAKDKQSEIFKAFTQAEDDTKNRYGGTGLGLSICAGYVKDMGGKLSLESELNKGSTFYFDIPMEIKDYAVKFKSIEDSEINIAILMTKKNSFVANHIARYFVKIGISVDKIEAVTSFEEVSKDVTHLLAFENKLCGEIFVYAKRNQKKLLVIEEKFLSLNDYNLDGAALISQYTYFGEALYNFVNKKKIPKILIVEDDFISSILLKAMFENEYCEVHSATNGQDGLEMLSSALRNNNPYDIVYTDHSMPLLSGSEMLERYFTLEKKKSIKKLVTVSVSGESENLNELYDFDFYATKPFSKKEIVSIFLKTIKPIKE
jgi:CheY-like chemotaxis protein